MLWTICHRLGQICERLGVETGGFELPVTSIDLVAEIQDGLGGPRDNLDRLAETLKRIDYGNQSRH